MPKQQISNVWIAIEDEFHSPNSDGQPDDTSLTWIPMEVFYASVSHDGQESPMAPNEIARGGSEGVPPEFVASVDPSTGEKGERLTGTLNLNSMVRGIGDGGIYSNHSSLPLAIALKTSMRSVSDPASATDPVAASGANAAEFECTTPGLYTVGAGICANVDGVLVYRRVVDITGAVITVTPQWPRLLTNEDTIRLCHTLYPPKMGQHGVQPQGSVAIRYELEGRTWVAYGCRLQEVAISPGDNNVAVANLTLRTAWAKRGSAQTLAKLPNRNASMKPAVPLGVQMALASATVENGSAGSGQAYTALKAKSHSFQYTANLAEQSDPQSHAGFTELEVGSWSCQATITTLYNATIEDMADKEERRTLAFGWGPIKAGCGLGVVVGGAYLGAKALPSFDGEQTTLNDVAFMAGEYNLDSTNTDAGNAPVIICLPL